MAGHVPRPTDVERPEPTPRVGCENAPGSRSLCAAAALYPLRMSSTCGSRAPVFSPAVQSTHPAHGSTSTEKQQREALHSPRSQTVAAERTPRSNAAAGGGDFCERPLAALVRRVEWELQRCLETLSAIWGAKERGRRAYDMALGLALSSLEHSSRAASFVAPALSGSVAHRPHHQLPHTRGPTALVGSCRTRTRRKEPSAAMARSRGASSLSAAAPARGGGRRGVLEQQQHHHSCLSAPRPPLPQTHAHTGRASAPRARASTPPPRQAPPPAPRGAWCVCATLDALPEGGRARAVACSPQHEHDRPSLTPSSPTQTHHTQPRRPRRRSSRAAAAASCRA